MGPISIGKKTVVVVTGSESTKGRIMHQLEKLLEDCVEIIGFAQDEWLEKPIVGDLIVFSSNSLIEEATPFIVGHPIQIQARRAIDSTHLDQLFILPRGSQVLLVNDSKESTDESIELLTLLGFDNVTWWPYHPEMPEQDRLQNTEKCHMAVTLGERELVPEGMLEVVDLGPRIIDLSTIVEILHYLELLDEKGHYVSATYFATVVKMGKTIHKAMAEQEKLNERLGHVLHQINDGIIAYDQNGIVKVFSERCELIFNMRTERAIGKPITQVIKEPQLLSWLKTADESQELLMRIGSESYAASRFTSGHSDWHVCILKSLTDVAALELKRKQQLLQKGHVAKYDFNDIIYQSEVMSDAVHAAKRIARTKLAVLIYGESGTGKELFASAIHRNSLVSEGPFLAVNFSALPEDLVESELFGYEEGAFTGAKKGGRAGLFEQASGGTLFLDEIGDISLKIQARLLRVLQEKEIMRVGGIEIIPVDVRIIAATNKNLMSMCQSGTFREDLFYRLKRLYVETPPLRSRIGDLECLIAHFLKKNDSEHYTLSHELKEALKLNPWRGNVRELESVVEYLVAVSEDSHLTLNELPADVLKVMATENNYNETTSNGGKMVGDIRFNGDKKVVNGDNVSQLTIPLNLVLQWIYQEWLLGHSVGRERLSEVSQTTEWPFTPEQIRNRIKKIEALGYITVNKGRSGIQLTSSGLSYCQKYLPK